MTFNSSNNRFYKMTIIGYDDGGEITEASSSLARDRAIVVFKYFSSREETEYIIKRTPSTYTQSCVGEINYYIKYKMPFDFQWLNLYNLPEDEKTENGISLASKVHIIIEEDQEDCLGEYYDYDWPAQDTVLSGNHAKVMIPKGTLEYIHHTKDTIPYSCNIEYKEMLSLKTYKQLFTCSSQETIYYQCWLHSCCSRKETRLFFLCKQGHYHSYYLDFCTYRKTTTGSRT